MRKIISVVTATRAEYGLLRPLIKSLKDNKNFDVRLAVTGAHLSQKYGYTYEEILGDELSVDIKIDTLLDSNTSVAATKSMALTMIEFANYFEILHPDLILILGDRYEMLAISTTAMMLQIPIAHLYGGDTTEGAIDEAIRHCITKQSYLHFVSTIDSRNRVCQLGENPERVFVVGELGIENIKNEELISKEDLSNLLNLDLNKPFGIVTYHSVTLESQDDTKYQFQNILDACTHFKNQYNFIFTKSNTDPNSQVINTMIDAYVQKNSNTFCFISLGTKKYLSLLNCCQFVMGNSSSGLIEVPSFKKPTINIGNRQKGRLCPDSVINCSNETEDIIKAIEESQTNDFRLILKNATNPYGDGNTSILINNILEEWLTNKQISLMKEFYNYYRR
ncbi:MAG: UDP-N-acetylglucosamine 2-epimerase [Erysipelotrichales bacterium]|nr:UDP-N-acetylglucosamine 2-epimerase [Erysipelotrichales bacterium]